MKNQKPLSRRGLLRGAAAATATLAMPTLVPASALGLGGRVPPSDRVVMGFIGVGSQGRGNLNWFLQKSGVQVVAVCDVDRVHRDGAQRLVDERQKSKGCASLLDYRELVAREDLDAVALALPDHWHALPAIAAARAGLDIYGEKPLARTVAESREIRDAVHRYGRVWQTGSWQRSRSHFRKAAELVRRGCLGRITRVEVGLPTGSSSGVQPPKPVPEGLDWDRWLGPAPWRPYCDFGRLKCHWDWRWILAYSGGQLTDWAGHHIDIAHWSLGLDHSGPVAVEGVGNYPADGLWDAPTGYRFTCTYANGLELLVCDQQQLGFMGTKWFGEDGVWLHVSRSGIWASDEALLADDVYDADEDPIHHAPPGLDHVDDFLRCVRTRQEPIAPVEAACRSITVAHLGEIAMQTRRKIRWDPRAEEIVDDEGASALLSRAQREPWLL